MINCFYFVVLAVVVEDIDECTVNSHNCDAAASCTNTAGSFTCSCNAGYEGNGQTCTGEKLREIGFFNDVDEESFSNISPSSGFTLQILTSAPRMRTTAMPWLLVLTRLDLLCARAIRDIQEMVRPVQVSDLR